MAAQVPDQPWKAAKADQWDSETVETFVEANAHTADARWLTQLDRSKASTAPRRPTSRCSTCCRRSAASAATSSPWSAARRASASSAARSSSPSGSPPKLGRRVVLGAPVRAIHRHLSGCLVVESARGEWQAKRALVAVPPPLVDRIEFQPPLLPSHSQLAQRQPMGTAIKCNAVYERPFWRPTGPERLRDLRHRPGEDHLRQLAARRQAPASWSASSRAAPAATSTTARRQARRTAALRVLRPLLRRRLRCTRRATWSWSGRRSRTPGAPTAPTTRPAC